MSALTAPETEPEAPSVSSKLLLRFSLSLPYVPPLHEPHRGLPALSFRLCRFLLDISRCLVLAAALAPAPPPPPPELPPPL